MSINNNEKNIRINIDRTISNIFLGLAHNMSNVVNSLNIKVHKIMYDVESGNYSNLKEKLRSIQELSTMLSFDLSKIRDYHKSTTNTKEVISLNNILSECLDLLETKFRNLRINIITNIFKNELFIQGDKNMIRQCIINILLNSCEAINDRGKIKLQLLQNEAFNTILVTDNGIGIPNELVKKIFEPFFTTKQNCSGLGLSVARQIIEDHNGNILIESSNKGTTIQINLPIYEEKN